MVHVRLEHKWTDPVGRSHGPGDMIEVDAGTLADLEVRGIVTTPGGTSPDDGTVDPWAGSGNPGDN